MQNNQIVKSGGKFQEDHAVSIDVLVAEIGSTTTVVNAFNGIRSHAQTPCLYGQGQAPTTVEEGDVRIGLQNAIDDLCRKKGIAKNTQSGTYQIEYGELLATSSAAGGLKMTVHGLVYDMTAKAAKEAALGAGAILHQITAGKLRRMDLQRIQEIQPNLILLAGGVDHGEQETALANAEQIHGLQLNAPVIYAGNCDAREEIRSIFEQPQKRNGLQSGRQSAQPLYLVENVYPKIDQLNIEPCRRAIQQAFEMHITNAPGMEHIRDMVSGTIIPTPGAVMECTKLLHECLGNVLVLDVGGATTDVHSVAEESEKIARILTAPEPYAKRTVEGDLGVFVNRRHVMESLLKRGQYEMGEAQQLEGEALQKIGERVGMTAKELSQQLVHCRKIPQTEQEIKLAELLTEACVVQAIDRHAGKLRYIYGPTGRSTLAEGKDLTQVRYIIGTGGALTRLPQGEAILRRMLGSGGDAMRLFPEHDAEILIDHDYIMASLGVLAKHHREAAIRLLEHSLRVPLI